jgi:Raf kinase inhibitor-like YbhB/YbcL family protein
MALIITSPAFPAHGEVPRQFTRDAANVSPPIEWRDAPSETRSFVLVVEDPDAPNGTFWHWAVYDIPEDSTGLDQGAGSQERTVALRMGENDFGNTRYDGPQPPRGHGTHHYHFRLFALRVPKLDVPAQCSAKDVAEAAQAQCLAEGDLVGTSEKPGAATQKTKARAQVRPHIADADKIARTGSANESVRDTPPAGKWNDVARNE